MRDASYVRRVTFRLTPSEMRQLVARARSTDATLSDTIRRELGFSELFVNPSHYDTDDEPMVAPSEAAWTDEDGVIRVEIDIRDKDGLRSASLERALKRDILWTVHGRLDAGLAEPIRIQFLGPKESS